jgi:hypothetical protein
LQETHYEYEANHNDDKTARGGAYAASLDLAAWIQGLTLVHFSAQLERFL